MGPWPRRGAGALARPGRGLLGKPPRPPITQPPPLAPLHQLGIYEAFKVKHSALMSATEATEMILRVDDIIKAAPRRRQG